MKHYYNIFELIIGNSKTTTNINHKNLRDRWDLDIFLEEMLKEVQTNQKINLSKYKHKNSSEDWKLTVIESFEIIYPEFTE